MNAFGPYYALGDNGSSSRYYVNMRRRRSWSMNGPRGLEGYAQFVLGDTASADTATIAGAEAAAFDQVGGGSSVARSIAIGVATGALTFLINHWLGKVLK